MQRKVSKSKSAFYGRKEFGSSLESKVERLFKNKGIYISHLNAEMLPEYHLTELSFLKDATSMYIKLLPDFLCTIPSQFSFFLECKRAYKESKFYSFSTDEFKFQRSLSEKWGIKILVVFSDWTGRLAAQWINDINEFESYDGSKASGSSKDFILIRKSTIPNLTYILNGIN